MCEHKWEMFAENEMIDRYGNCAGIKYHLQCEKCGEIKFVRS